MSVVKRRAVILGAVLVVACVVLVLRRRPSQDAVFFEEAALLRGDLADVQREAGVLVSRDPLNLKTGISGTLEWVVEDEDWVAAGDRIYIVNVDDVLASVTEARTDVLGLQQELALERMRRRHSDGIEERKVQAALRQWELAKVRYRILSATPQGGRRLIELHEQLLPIEEETAAVRTRYEALQDAYQSAQDAYLTALDDLQEVRDGVGHRQTKIDEYTVKLAAKVDDAKPEGTARRDSAAEALATARAEIAELKLKFPALEARLDEARRARDVAQVPRDKVLADLAAREAREKELYIELEIEKRGIKRVQLELDAEAGELRRQNAARAHEEGEVAFQSGAISQLQLKKLASSLRAIESDLEILRQKIAIASRPEPEEVLTEARLQAERARAQADKARELKARALKAIDQKIRLVEARLAAKIYDIDQQATNFPEVLDFSIRFLEREAEALDESVGDRLRKTEIDEELARLRSRVALVRDAPPNVGLSPIDGVVRVARHWGKAYQTGDRVDAETILMQIYPSSALEVKAAVNETMARRINPGMPAQVTVPALRGRSFAARIARAARVGKDKYHDQGDGAWAGVTEFDVRIALDDVSDDLRPGMTAIASTTVAALTNVLYLPRAAVWREPDGYRCLAGSERDRAAVALEGHFFGDDAFVVTRGLSEGERIWIRRRRSL